MQFFSDLKVGIKLGGAFSILVLLTIAIGGFAVKQLAAVNASTEDIATNWLPSIKTLARIRDAVNDYRRQEIRHVLALDDKEMDDREKGMSEAKKALADLQAKYEPMIASDEERKSDIEMKKALDVYWATTAKLLPLSRGGEQTLAQAKEYLSGDSTKAFQDVMAIASKLIELNDKGADAANKQADATYAQARAWVIGLLAGAVILAILLAMSITRLITRSLNSAVAVAQRVAAGDLTSVVEVTSKDECGALMQALKDMNENLAKIVYEVRTGVDSITTGSQEIASGNADLSQRTEEQASSLEETASSMEELASTVKQNAENARQANELAASASETAVKGGKVVGEVVQTMSSINQSSKKIADIIGVIDGIAFQTNILALNAAVEAARAGEQGRGFAVVASEVRSLAQRSASAAKEIKDLISDSVNKVETGARLVDDAGRTMDEIVTSVKRVTDVMAEITAAAHAQSSGIEQVNQAVMQMDQVTQQNAALVEEAAAAAESMREQAHQLDAAVAVFKLANGAQAASVKAPAADSAPHAERRTPGRAKNVARLPLKLEPKRTQKPAPAARTGTDGEWSEF